MFHPRLAVIVRVAARLQNVIKPNEVGLNICIRVGDRIAHPCLRRKIYYYLRMIFRKNRCDEVFIGQIAFDKRKIG